MSYQYQLNNYYHHNHHSHNLSINSISSIIEPTTPPNNSSTTSTTTDTSNNNTASEKYLANNNQSHQIQQNQHQQQGIVLTPATTATPMSTSSTSKSTSFHMRSLSNGGGVGFLSNSKGGVSSSSANSKSILWDSSNKLNQNLNLPNFSIDNEVVSTPLIVPPVGQDQQTTSSFATQQQRHQRAISDFVGFDDKENMIMNKSIITTTPSVVSLSNLDNQSATVAITDKVNGNNFVNGVGVSTFIAAPAGTGSATSGCTPSSSASTPSDFTSTMTPPIRMPQKIDKEYLASINKLPLIQLKLEILKLAKDQYGCRFLQKKIDESLVPNYQVRLANFDTILTIQM